jgi:hypothetical protein
VGARPGLRVNLEGNPGNPCAVGAVVRVRCGENWGPARELRSGSGYWSQDSLVPVLGTPQPPTAVQVRWPGGRVTECPIEQPVLEIKIRTDGTPAAARP